MELSCQSCLAELFLELLHGTVVQNSLCEAIFELLRGSVVQKLPLETMFSSFCLELSSNSRLAKLSLKVKCRLVFSACCAVPLSDGLWKRSWAQSGLCWAQSDQSARDAACSSRAQVALRSYFLSFCMELSCQSCLAELFLKPLHGTVVQNLLCEAIF